MFDIIHHYSSALFTPVKALDNSLTNKGIFAPFSPAKNVDSSVVDKGIIKPLIVPQTSEVVKQVASEPAEKKPASKLITFDKIIDTNSSIK